MLNELKLGPEYREWDKILQSFDLGMDNGLRLGIHKIMYIPSYRDIVRCFGYTLNEKVKCDNPYYIKKGGQHKVSIEHKRERKRLNKRAERLRKKLIA